jgi:hypothetical protein
MQIQEVLTAARSPWQNPFAERLIGSIRRDCLDHVIVLSERHLRTILTAYSAYYHHTRPHLALTKDTPAERPVEPSEMGLARLAEHTAPLPPHDSSHPLLSRRGVPVLGSERRVWLHGDDPLHRFAEACREAQLDQSATCWRCLVSPGCARCSRMDYWRSAGSVNPILPKFRSRRRPRADDLRRRRATERRSYSEPHRHSPDRAPAVGTAV